MQFLTMVCLRMVAEVNLIMVLETWLAGTLVQLH